MADIAGYASLSADINKRKSEPFDENKEGISSDKIRELTLEMKDEDIIKLTEKWEKTWKDSNAKQEWEKQIEENEKYWLGKHFDIPKADKVRAQVDNLIFESLETYLPQATRRNPDPIVTLDSSELIDGNENPVHTKYLTKVKLKLSDVADKNKLRLKLKKGARHWAIYQLGVAKHSWDLDKDIPTSKIVRPRWESGNGLKLTGRLAADKKAGASSPRSPGKVVATNVPEPDWATTKPWVFRSS